MKKWFKKREKVFNSIFRMILVFAFVIITVWGELRAKVAEGTLGKAEKAPQAVDNLRTKQNNGRMQFSEISCKPIAK